MLTVEELKGYSEVDRSKIYFGDLIGKFESGEYKLLRHVIFVDNYVLVDLENDNYYAPFPGKISCGYDACAFIPKKNWISLDEILSDMSYPEILEMRDILKLLNEDWISIYKTVYLDEFLSNGIHETGASEERIKKHFNDCHPHFKLSIIERKCGVVKRKLR